MPTLDEGYGDCAVCETECSVNLNTGYCEMCKREVKED